MKKNIFSLLIIGILLSGCWGDEAPKYGLLKSKPEGVEAQKVVALVENAISYMKEAGDEDAFKAFTMRDPRFVEGNVYIFVNSFDPPMILADGNTHENVVGEDWTKIKDKPAREAVDAIMKHLESNHSGWLRYPWPHPETGKVIEKISYYEKFGNYAVGAGYYPTKK